MMSKSDQEVVVVGEEASRGAVTLFKEPGGVALKARKKIKVLDEDTYTESMSKIIERDFFPDLAKMKAQLEYQDAVQRNDLREIQRLKVKFSVKDASVRRPSSVRSTPTSFETPVRGPETTPSTSGTPGPPQDGGPVKESAGVRVVEDVKEKHVSLDDFLAKYTSEDNDSFEDLMEETHKKHMIRYPWMYVNENEKREEFSDALALPSIEKQALDETKHQGLLTWSYTNRNSVMYYPDGAPLSEKEQLEASKREEVIYDNTRFKRIPFNEHINKTAILEAAQFQAKINEGRIGVDGKEVQPKDIPELKGYSFVSMTPSPAPGVAQSPLMTWGEIEGTPFRLDASDTPLHGNLAPGAPQFKIPEPPARDMVGHRLAEKLSKKQREKKTETLKRVTSTLRATSSPFGTSPKTPLERLNNMSPAAQKLATMKLGINRNTDRRLLASYSPASPVTPSRTPTMSVSPLTRKLTPKLNLKSTPTSMSSRKREVISKDLTDNLLNLSKRNKASDFF